MLPLLKKIPRMHQTSLGKNAYLMIQQPALSTGTQRNVNIVAIKRIKIAMWWKQPKFSGRTLHRCNNGVLSIFRKDQNSIIRVRDYAKQDTERDMLNCSIHVRLSEVQKSIPLENHGFQCQWKKCGGAIRVNMKCALPGLCFKCLVPRWWCKFWRWGNFRRWRTLKKVGSCRQVLRCMLSQIISPTPPRLLWIMSQTDFVSQISLLP